MSTSAVVKYLQELNQKIDSLTEEELEQIFKDYPYILNEYPTEMQEGVLDINSPEFLRQT